MPKAKTADTTSAPRRAFLAGIATAITAPAVAGATSAGEGAHQDVALHSLGAPLDRAPPQSDAAAEPTREQILEYLANEAELLEICEEHQQIVDRYRGAELLTTEGGDFVLPYGDMPRARELVEIISASESTTRAGRHAKAKALLFYANYDESGELLLSDPVAILGASLAWDIVQMTKRVRS